jgi:hypothetical protein
MILDPVVPLGANPVVEKFLELFLASALLGRRRCNQTSNRENQNGGTECCATSHRPNETTPSLPHSFRISLDGSTASARRAGMADAARPSSAIVKTAPMTTTGSREFA